MKKRITDIMSAERLSSCLITPKGTEAEKAWVDGISDVDLVAYGEKQSDAERGIGMDSGQRGAPTAILLQRRFPFRWDRSTFSQTAVTS